MKTKIYLLSLGLLFCLSTDFAEADCTNDTFDCPGISYASVDKNGKKKKGHYPDDTLPAAQQNTKNRTNACRAAFDGCFKYKRASDLCGGLLFDLLSITNACDGTLVTSVDLKTHCSTNTPSGSGDLSRCVSRGLVACGIVPPNYPGAPCDIFP